MAKKTATIIGKITYKSSCLRPKVVDQAPGNYWYYDAIKSGETLGTVEIVGFFDGSNMVTGDLLKVNSADSVAMYDVRVTNTVVTISQTGGGGQKGDKGDSAYQVWLNAGHTGTEADFLASLKGEQGASGKDGATGPAGKDGANGKDGATGATGPKGEQGATGAKGDQGIQGVKGDTGAKGEKGDKGDPGENNVMLTFPVYMMTTENGVRSHDITIRSISGSNQGTESGIVSQSSGLVRLSKLLSFLVEEKQTLKVTCRVLIHNLDTIAGTNYYVNTQGLGVTTGGQYVNVGKEQTIQLDKTKYKTNVVTFTIEDTTVTQLIAVGFRLHLQYADGTTTAIFGEAVISGSLT